MVTGLDLFREYFAGYEDRYVLIGGASAALAMQEADLEFRSTKDLDIVLTIEALDVEFGKAFWEFIEHGRYKHRQRSTGKEQYYRFEEPGVSGYPAMLELFSRLPDVIHLDGEARFTPLPIGEDVASLSAILLDPDYYTFINTHKRVIGGLSALGADGLIPLKARAWVDLSARKLAGEAIDSKNVLKHRNDILRLYSVLDLAMPVVLPLSIRTSFAEALVKLESEPGINLKQFNINRVSLTQLVDELRRVYGLKSMAADPGGQE
jgi:hypothetical protein